MHALRRGFCRNWWNDRWRDLTAAYLTFLAGGEETISFPAGGGAEVRIMGSMTRLTSPVSVQEPESPEVAEDDIELDINDDELDLFDDDLAESQQAPTELIHE
jgi:hypothetical protein